MLLISQPEFDEIRRHGEREYPHECCGILLGTNDYGKRTVKQAVPAGNTRRDRPADRYHIAPEELIRAQRLARDQGLDIIGFYHSHPDCAAQWSATDLAEAHWLGCSYVITSVMEGQAYRTNSFALAGESEESKRFEDERVEVTPAAVAAMARVAEAASPTPAPNAAAARRGC